MNIGRVLPNHYNYGFDGYKVIIGEGWNWVVILNVSDRKLHFESFENEVEKNKSIMEWSKEFEEVY